MPISRTEFMETRMEKEEMNEYAQEVHSYMENPEQVLYDNVEQAFTAEEIAERVAEMSDQSDHPSVPGRERVKNDVQTLIEVNGHFKEIEDITSEYHPEEDAIYYMAEE